jgi:predicted DsbA family dithiol-disulfide isomerase
MARAAAGGPPIEVVEITDPACPWAWGVEPALRAIRWRYAHLLRWRTVLTVLAPLPTGPEERSDEELQRLVEQRLDRWRTTSSHTGMPHPVALRRLPRQSEASCLAVKAAALDDVDAASRLMRRLRESQFAFGDPPADLDAVLAAAEAIPGLRRRRLRKLVGTDAARAGLAADHEEARSPDEHVRRLVDDRPGNGTMKVSDGRERYAVPTLRFRGPAGEATVPGWHPLEDYEAALEQVLPGVRAQALPAPSATHALLHHGSLTRPEVRDLCGSDEVPQGAVTFDTPGGPLWLTPEEAYVRLGQAA